VSNAGRLQERKNECHGCMYFQNIRKIITEDHDMTTVLRSGSVFLQPLESESWFGSDLRSQHASGSTVTGQVGAGRRVGTGSVSGLEHRGFDTSSVLRACDSCFRVFVLFFARDEETWVPGHGYFGWKREVGGTGGGSATRKVLVRSLSITVQIECR
jgi:hypothetical protein